MSSAAILGANGQDGSFLCEIQAAAGHRVLAVGLQPEYAWDAPAGEFSYHQLDISDQSALRTFLAAQQPESIFHVAAVHGAAGFRYEPVGEKLFAVSLVSVHSCLEYLRERGEGQLFYASSCKVFGESLRGNIDENTSQRADCLYSVAKIAAGKLINCYRRDHGVSAVVGFLFNHESTRRPPQFFIPTVARALANGLAGTGVRETLNSLDFYADWGSAREFMQLASEALQLGVNEDLVVASGTTVYAADAVKSLFDAHSLDYRDHLEVATSDGQGGAPPFTANVSKLSALLGSTPGIDFSQLVEDIAGAAG